MDPNAKPIPLDEEQAPDEQIEVPPAEGEIDKKVVDLDEEEANAQDFKKLDNQAFAAMRKEASEAKKALAEREKKIQEYEARLKQQEEKPVIPPQGPMYGPPRRQIGGVPVPETREEWDALARKDWQLAVDMRSILNSERINDERKSADRAMSVLEESKQEVLEKHPELNDAASEKGRIFTEILRENPQYATHPEGPILVMYKMEKKMREMGLSLEPANNGAKTEATRASRATLTGAGRMTPKTGRTVTLSKDDLEFCKNSGIDPKDYAKEKLENEARLKGAQL